MKRAKKLNVGLYGGDGKMGNAVEQIFTLFEKNLTPFLFVGKKKTSALFAISVVGLQNIEPDLMSDVDVWIDFTSPEGLSELLSMTEKYKTPVVSGSTGLADSDFADLKKRSARRPLFWASNMSLGLWAFRQAMKGLAPIRHFDFATEEIHHTQKKDRPSGTAKTLHRDLEMTMGKKIDTATSFRLGGVFGVHKVFAASSNEMITMEHQALNRTVFAEGALVACDWLVKKKSGLYSMDDLFIKYRAKKK